jgi:hypothetical protein
MEKEFTKSENGESLIIKTTHEPIVKEENYDYSTLEKEIEYLENQIVLLSQNLLEKQKILAKFDELKITKKEPQK